MTTAPDLDAGDFRTPVPLRRNRLHWFAGRTHEVLDEIGQPATWAMTPHERGETIAELLALRSRIEAHLFTVVADADRDDTAASAGATSTAAWVRAGTGVTGAEATRLVRHARAIESHPPTHTALAQGVINTEQATVIVAAVDALPAEVADRAPEAETHLLALADQHDARALRGLGRHLLEVIAPDQADALIARHLEREETEASKTCFLKTWSDGHGSTYGRFKVPDLTGTFLTTALEALANPNRPDPIPRKGAAAPGVRAGVLRTARTPPRRPAPPDRRRQRHRDRHHDPRHPPVGYAPRASWAPTPCSPLARPVAWPPQPASSPPSSTANPSSSTSVDDAPSPNPSGSPWPCDKADSATSRAVNAPPPGATPTTENSGARAAAPPSTTAN